MAAETDPSRLLPIRWTLTNRPERVVDPSEMPRSRLSRSSQEVTRPMAQWRILEMSLMHTTTRTGLDMARAKHALAAAGVDPALTLTR